MIDKRHLVSIMSNIVDGERSSMVEPRIVIPVVAGSSPVAHPYYGGDSRLFFSDYEAIAAQYIVQTPAKDPLL